MIERIPTAAELLCSRHVQLRALANGTASSDSFEMSDLERQLRALPSHERHVDIGVIMRLLREEEILQ